MFIYVFSGQALIRSQQRINPLIFYRLKKVLLSFVPIVKKKINPYLHI